MDKKAISGDINRLLFVTLDNYKKIASPRVSLLPIDNIYSRLPGLAFRFENGVDSDYTKLNSLLNSFSGKEIWVCYKPTNDQSKNYLIEPVSSKDLRTKEQYDMIDLKKIVDNVVDDIQPLCDFLSGQLKYGI